MRPRIFEQGTITLALNNDSFRLYVDTFEIEANGIFIDSNTKKVTISIDQENKIKMDEQIRILKTLPWIVVT